MTKTKTWILVVTTASVIADNSQLKYSHKIGTIEINIKIFCCSWNHRLVPPSPRPFKQYLFVIFSKGPLIFVTCHSLTAALINVLLPSVETNALMETDGRTNGRTAIKMARFDNNLSCRLSTQLECFLFCRVLMTIPIPHFSLKGFLFQHRWTWRGGHFRDC